MKVRLTPPNPIQSEAGAFGFLIWFVGVVVILAIIVLILEAI
jgi:hypothetical protein